MVPPSPGKQNSAFVSAYGCRVLAGLHCSKSGHRKVAHAIPGWVAADLVDDERLSIQFR